MGILVTPVSGLLGVWRQSERWGLSRKMMGAYEDGEETKSDFLARMMLMGRLEVDQQNKTLISLTKCEREESTPGAGTGCDIGTVPAAAPAATAGSITGTVPSSLLETLKDNPMVGCQITNCQEYSVTAKGFISMYNQTMQEHVLDGAKSLIQEVSECQDLRLSADGEAVKNPANFLAEEWHHKYLVNFKVMAQTDPKQFLDKYFESN